jgi:predicted phosphodiesterase
MRVAVVSDILGNLTFKAVLADIRQASPDLVLHAGDLADGGSNPIEIVDRIRALGWQGVMGNTDEMLVQPDSLEDFANQSSAPPALWAAIREIASATRSKLGDKRLAWLRETTPRDDPGDLRAGPRHSSELLAGARSRSDRCRAPSHLWTPRPADHRLWAHPSPFDPQLGWPRKSPHQYRKRWTSLRRRFPRILSDARRKHALHPQGRVQPREGAEGPLILRTTWCRMDSKNASHQLSSDAIDHKVPSTVKSAGENPARPGNHG